MTLQVSHINVIVSVFPYEQSMWCKGTAGHTVPKEEHRRELLVGGTAELSAPLKASHLRIANLTGL
jgi:hypothetical protein